MKRRMSSILVLLAILAIGVAASGLTADEILDAMEAAEDEVAESGMVTAVTVETVGPSGESPTYLMYGISKPGKMLMYYAEPELEAGNMLLFVEEEVDGETKTRFWTYLPVFEFVKELVSEEEQGGSFAGSGLSISDVGGGDVRDDYDVVLLREETIAVGEMEREAYVLESTAKAESNVEDVRVVMWVDKEFYVVLKTEAYNDLGNLSSSMATLALDEFEGRLTWGTMENTVRDDVSTFTIAARRRPEGEISDEVFRPENLKDFNPADWGF
jgi:outer membrane lipoprotein-sorting protein